MRSMLRRWPPRAEPVRTRVFRPARADVSPAVSPATPPPAITTSYSWFDTQTDPSWFACGTVYHAANGLEPHISAFAANQRAVPIHALRFGFVTYGPVRLQH